MTHARRLQHLPLVLLLAACAEPSAIAPCLDLAEVRRYGVMDDSESDNAAPGALGDIRGIVVGPNGDVFVLDRSSHRIVAFDSAGAARVVAGRAGEGPGEFILPMHLASTGRGVSVPDYELRRITEFDWSGRLLNVTRLEALPPPWRHIVRNDTAWVAYNQNTSGDKLFDLVRLATGEVTAGRGLEAEDMPFGAGLGIAFTSNGELVVNTARPGVWMAQSDDSWIRRGSPRFPDDVPPREEQTGPLQYRVTPAQHISSGLAVIGDSLILQGTFSYPRPFDWNDPPARDEGVRSLDVYRADGQHVASLPIPPGAVTNVLTSDPVTGRILVPVNQPFPQVVEYRLETCQQPHNGADFQGQARLGAPILSLGEMDGDSRYTFARIGGVRLGNDVIVVADGGSAELRFYDLRGRFQHSSGRKGIGPGEHISVKLIPDWQSDSLVVFDQAARRVSFLDARGKFGRTVQLPHAQREPGLAGTVDVLGINGNGRIITVTQAALQPTTTGLQRRQAIVAYIPRAGGSATRLGTFSGSELVYRVVGGSGIFSRLPFLQDFTAGVGAQSLYFVEGPTPLLIERNPTTGAIRQAGLPFESRRVTLSDYESWFERELLTIPAERRPDTRQYYRAMYDAWTMRPAAKVLIDDVGRIWVEEFTTGGNRRAAIYSADMRLVATVSLPANFTIATIRGGNVAGVVTDSNGVERVEVRPLLGA